MSSTELEHNRFTYIQVEGEENSPLPLPLLPQQLWEVVALIIHPTMHWASPPKHTHTYTYTTDRTWGLLLLPVCFCMRGRTVGMQNPVSCCKSVPDGSTSTVFPHYHCSCWCSTNTAGTSIWLISLPFPSSSPWSGHSPLHHQGQKLVIDILMSHYIQMSITIKKKLSQKSPNGAWWGGGCCWNWGRENYTGVGDGDWYQGSVDFPGHMTAILAFQPKRCTKKSQCCWETGKTPLCCSNPHWGKQWPQCYLADLTYWARKTIFSNVNTNSWGKCSCWNEFSDSNKLHGFLSWFKIKPNTIAFYHSKTKNCITFAKGCSRFLWQKRQSSSLVNVRHTKKEENAGVSTVFLKCVTLNFCNVAGLGWFFHRQLENYLHYNCILCR